jgi:spermidine synthase
VLWLRLLTLSMGHSARTVGILLAAFMGGLALGAWIAGRIAPAFAPSRAIRMYAALEAAIAGYALLLPLLLASARPFLQSVYADGDAALAFDTTIALLSLLLLTVPTAAMGATFPMAVRWAGVSRGSDRSRDGSAVAGYAGALYAANTFGAALGAALTGFALLPLLGVRGTTLVGVALNAIAALGALILAHRSSRDVTTAVEPTVPPRAADVAGRSRTTPEIGPQAGLGAAAAAVGVSGAVSLVYQVTWTRTLAMVLGPTTYAFSAMLVAVIAGLAIGSTIAAARRPRSPARAVMWLGAVMMTGAAAALAASFVVDRLPLVIASLVSQPGTSFGPVLAIQIGLVVAIQLPMSIAFGAAFPLAIAVVQSDSHTAPRDVSILYATNTVGAIAGAVASSFVLIPAFGIQTLIRSAAIVLAMSGVAIVLRTRRTIASGMRLGAIAAGAAVVVMAIAAPAWNQAVLANGGYRYATTLATGDIRVGLEAGRLLYYREGAAGTVSVRDVPGARSLAIDGKVDASNASDMLTQKLLAHLPLLMHPNPRRVCIIGLGSGVTLGSSLVHPIDIADVVEISPEVVEASSYFSVDNRDALKNPRTRLILGDGRSHMLLSTEQYDVIVSEPSNPWMAGVASLFTREFFLAARSRLESGGILMQWAHTYNISDADLRSIVATFVSVFPEGSVWLVGDSDLLLLGATAPIAALDHGLSASWARPGVASDLAAVGVRDPFSILSLYVGGGADLRRYSAGAIVQSDDRLLLEYSAPRALYQAFQRANVAQLNAVARSASQPAAVMRAYSDATSEQWRNRGLMQLKADATAAAYADLREALSRMPEDSAALHGLALAAIRQNRLEDVERLFSGIAYGDTSRASAAAAPGGPATVPALVELSIVRAALGRPDEATAAARDAVLRNPADPAALRQLASMYADSGDEEALQRLIQLVEQTAADRAVLLYCRTRLAYVRGEYELAARLGEELAALDPADVNVRNLLGSAYAALGDNDRARQALEASLRIEPANPGVLVNLGTVALRAGDSTAAVERFSEALFLSPTHPAALSGLADAFDLQGSPDRAAEIRAHGSPR